MHDSFYFRGHLCISFELHSLSLYDFLKNNNFQGLSLGLIKRFATQILVSFLPLCFKSS
jgi:dual specificity tyrosine-phosphorylation-regulated kinase 2/3/4